MRGWVWCVQSSERTEKRIRKRPIGAGIDPKKQAKPARFAEDVSEIVDQLNSMPLVGIAEVSGTFFEKIDAFKLKVNVIFIGARCVHLSNEELEIQRTLR